MRIYNLIFKTIFPLIFLRSVYKSLRFGENFSRFLEKLSFYNGEKSTPIKILNGVVQYGMKAYDETQIGELVRNLRSSDHGVGDIGVYPKTKSYNQGTKKPDG